MAEFSGSEIALIITAAGTFITAMTSSAAVLIGVWNSRKIKEVHLSTNGMKEELVASTARENHAQGYIDGRSELRSDIRTGKIEIQKDKP